MKRRNIIGVAVGVIGFALGIAGIWMTGWEIAGKLVATGIWSLVGSSALIRWS